MKKTIVLFSLFLAVNTVSLMHGYRIRLVNETKYPGKMHVENKSFLCRNIHRDLQPGESHEEGNGACNVRRVIGEVFIPLTVSRLKDQPEYEKVTAIPYEPPFGRTGTKTDTYVLVQEDSKYGPSVFRIVRR